MAWRRRFDGYGVRKVEALAARCHPSGDWSRPLRCPKCGGTGYLDLIDLVECTTRQHCPDCWYRWETSATEGASDDDRAAVL